LAITQTSHDISTITTKYLDFQEDESTIKVKTSLKNGKYIPQFLPKSERKEMKVLGKKIQRKVKVVVELQQQTTEVQ